MYIYPSPGAGERASERKGEVRLVLPRRQEHRPLGFSNSHARTQRDKAQGRTCRGFSKLLVHTLLMRMSSTTSAARVLSPGVYSIASRRQRAEKGESGSREDVAARASTNIICTQTAARAVCTRCLFLQSQRSRPNTGFFSESPARHQQQQAAAREQRAEGTSGSLGGRGGP